METAGWIGRVECLGEVVLVGKGESHKRGSAILKLLVHAWYDLQ